MTPSSTLRKSTIEKLINSNQYQVLRLKRATGSKMAAAEPRFSSKYWEYNGKTTSPKIPLTFKSRPAGLILRISGIRGYQREKKGVWLPILSTQPFALNWIPCQVFQPVLTRPLTSAVSGQVDRSLYCRDAHSLFPGQHLLVLITLPKPRKNRKYVVPGWVWTLEKH